MLSNCPRCGLDLPQDIDNKFCIECGHDLSVKESPVTDAQPNVDQAQEDAPPQAAGDLAKENQSVDTGSDPYQPEQMTVAGGLTLTFTPAAPKGKGARGRKKKDPPIVHQHTFVDDDWEEDLEGKDKARELDDDFDNDDLKKWLRAKKRRIASSTDPKIQYLLRNRGNSVRLTRNGSPFEALVYDVFVKKNFNKIYVNLVTDDGDRSFGLDSFEIEDPSKDGTPAGCSSSVGRGCGCLLAVLVLIFFFYTCR